MAPFNYPFTKGRAGLPTTVTPGGTSLVTTAPMPTTAPGQSPAACRACPGGGLYQGLQLPEIPALQILRPRGVGFATEEAVVDPVVENFGDFGENEQTSVTIMPPEELG